MTLNGFSPFLPRAVFAKTAYCELQFSVNKYSRPNQRIRKLVQPLSIQHSVIYYIGLNNLSALDSAMVNLHLAHRLVWTAVHLTIRNAQCNQYIYVEAPFAAQTFFFDPTDSHVTHPEAHPSLSQQLPIDAFLPKYIFAVLISVGAQGGETFSSESVIRPRKPRPPRRLRPPRAFRSSFCTRAARVSLFQFFLSLWIYLSDVSRL